MSEHHRWILGVIVTLAVGTLSNAEDRSDGPPRPYPVAHDAPLEAKLTEPTEAKDHARHRLEYNGIRGDRVPAYLYVPKASEDKIAGNAQPAKRPAVLLQYGSGGNKRTNYIVALGEQFVARGFVVLTIDVPGRGERKAGQGASSWRALLAGKNRFAQTMGDYSRAVDYLLTREDVDPERVGFAGISMGAITGIPFVAHDERIRAMASIVGGANFLGTLKVDLDPDALRAAERIDPMYHVALIAPRPLLLLNATHDQLVPRFFGEQLHKAAGERAKKVWMDTDHFFNGVDRYRVLGTVIDFMEEGLGRADANADGNARR